MGQRLAALGVEDQRGIRQHLPPHQLSTQLLVSDRSHGSNISLADCLNE
jgi:hypothetical protein